MRFWGWGDDAHAGDFPAHADDFLRRELDLPAGGGARAAALDAVRVRDAALPEAARAELEGICSLRDDHEARVLHAAGKAYPDLVRLRAGDAEDAPDAVVFPASHEEVR